MPEKEIMLKIGMASVGKNADGSRRVLISPRLTSCHELRIVVECISRVDKTIAGFNPISHLVEGLRALSLEGFSISATARAILVPMAIAIVALYIASRQLNARLRAN